MASHDFLLISHRRTWLRRRLLAWFERHARALPWRQTRDPYAIWVSEVMLQQTQVATVIAYYQRFLQAFPTIAALAQAEEPQVLRHWEGLGYYRRARDLHRAARILVAEHRGRIPNDPDLLGSLPGLGRYTTNAVLSQAYDRRLPILEANSSRVLCRLLGIEEDPRRAAVQRLLWDAGAALLPRKKVGQFNQSLMELGALVCTPTAPKCHACPVAHHCRAHAANLQEVIPLRTRQAVPIQVQEVAVVLWKGRKIFVVQRPAQGRWANLWEFPHREIQPGETTDQAALLLLEELGLRAGLDDQLAILKHTVTRFRITVTCLAASLKGGKLQSKFYQRGRWLLPEQLAHLPFSSPQRRLAGIVIGEKG